VDKPTVTFDEDIVWNDIPDENHVGPLVRLGPMTPEQHSTYLSARTDTRLRVVMVIVLALIFVGLNAGMGYLIHFAYSTDITLIREKLITPDQRSISEKAFMALIGATVVQVGLGIAAVVAYLFPKARGTAGAGHPRH
jgi:hypothetical protein